MAEIHMEQINGQHILTMMKVGVIWAINSLHDNIMVLAAINYLNHAVSLCKSLACNNKQN